MMKRTSIAALALSAAALVGIISEEGFTENAVIPVKNDRPTVGFGSTFREDGTPVRMGDTITPGQAVKRTLTHINKDEQGLKRCVTGPMSQVEYDILVNFSYQYGVRRTCESDMVLNTNAGDYEAACRAYTQYRRVDKYDCSTLINGKPNKRCWGVWTRSLERRDKCLAAQKGLQ